MNRGQWVRGVSWSLVGSMALPVAPAVAATPYRDPSRLFSLSVPDGWQLRPQARGSANDALWVNGSGVVAVLHESVGAGTSGIDYATASVGALSQLEGFEEFDRRFAPVGGEDQPLLDYVFTGESGSTIGAYSVFVTSGTTGYVISLYNAGDDLALYEADFLAFVAGFVPGTGVAGGTPGAATTPRIGSVGSAVVATPRVGGTVTATATPRPAGSVAPIATARTTPVAVGTSSRPAVVASPSVMRQPGSVRGTVFTEGGEPVTGGSVTVTIAGMTSGGGRVSFSLRPNARGEYSEQVSPGTYTVTAELKYVDTEGKVFTFPLDPVEPETAQDAAPGIVKNFRWKMTGLPAGRSANPNEYLFYGWQVQLRNGDSSSASATNPEKVYPGGKVRLTLTPNGAFWDGSPGAPVVRETVYMEPNIPDLPYANFTVGAELVDANGVAHPLVVSAGFSGTFAASVLVVLRPGSPRGAEAVGVSYKLA